MIFNDLGYLDPDKSVCFTGHRVLKKDFEESEVEKIVIKLINEGYEFFYNGMAMGFDLTCFKILLKLKKKYTFIKIIACVPCMNQSDTFNKKSKEKYKEYLKQADYTVIFSDKYNDFCMKERDRFMVDNCAVCISYLYKSVGGAYYTTSYAVSKERRIEYLK